VSGAVRPYRSRPDPLLLKVSLWVKKDCSFFALPRAIAYGATPFFQTSSTRSLPEQAIFRGILLPREPLLAANL